MTNKHRWLIFTSLVLGIVMVDIDMTAINLVASSIVQKLMLPKSTAQWIIDGYTMAAAVIMPIAGYYGHQYGRKRMFLVSLSIFIIASTLVGTSHGSTELIMSRIVQGACVAFTFILGTSIIRDIFPENRQGFAIGLLISIAGIAQALGPTIGGIIIHISSWRWIFFINIPLSLVAVALLSAFLPEKKRPANHKINAISAGLLMFSLFSLLTMSNELTQINGNLLKVVSLLLVSILSLICYFFRELKSTKPLLDLKLFSYKPYAMIITVRFFISFIYFSWLFLLGHLFTFTFKYPPMKSGFILLSLTLAIAILSAPVGKLIDKKSSELVLNTGLALLLLATILMIFIVKVDSIIFLCAALMIGGVANAFLFPASATSCIKYTPIKKSASGMGVFFTSGFVGCALGVGVLGSLTILTKTFEQGFTVSMIVCAVISLVLMLFSQSTNPNKK